MEYEITHDFGVVLASAAASVSTYDTLGATVGPAARFTSALIRNQSNGVVRVYEAGMVRIDAGVAKLVNFNGGARAVTIIPEVALVAGDVTADIQVEAPQ